MNRYITDVSTHSRLVRRKVFAMPFFGAGFFFARKAFNLMCIIGYDRKNVNSKLEEIHILSTNVVIFPRIWLLNHKEIDGY